MRSQGGEFYRGNQLGFGADELIAWFELWQRARRSRATPSAALVEQADSGEPARQLVVTGVTAASFAWSHQLPELQRLTEAELGIVGFPGPPGAQWARASMYWAAFRGTRHPDAVADVINFLTTNGEVGAVLGHERGLNASARRPPLRRGQHHRPGPATGRRVRRQHRRPARAGARRRRPKGHAKVRTLLVAAAESIRVKRDGTRDGHRAFPVAGHRRPGGVTHRRPARGAGRR